MIPSTLTATSGSSPSFGQLRYPKDVAYESYMDYVAFTFYDYKPPFAAETAFGPSAYNASVSSLGSSKGSILLYMPEDVEGEYGASWQDMNLSNMARGALGTFGAAAGGSSFVDGIGGAIKRASDTLGQVGANMLDGTIAANVLTDALGKANFGSLTVDDVFASTTGQVLNPNTEVLYKGPKTRNFTLNFKMVPRNAAEATDIKKIIHYFKSATLPRFGSAGDKKNASFIRVPQIVDVTFKQGSSNHPWVNQFKPSAITSLNFSYTPDGAWATLPNGSPVATTMRISFQELKMLYADELSVSGATY